ncbi:RagB/SusD family nutrient uptake outer membrane protein [Chitinophaga sp. XS-30]|uniref:RagB/SusD family nutrient uptake outer membrane protein n=1 Tax=Chitinophaga sp. XS-30 TaxID=2604421 RepID=UPI0011DD1117|nr:RagB/SusD family nutrient uptake outer membrane protein [Chitinophaga sp. XS-30]QEH42207.1 RagB/SusD family nutrient uptake outer membrane protein [Chitinophaga sp. XS-30]
MKNVILILVSIFSIVAFSSCGKDFLNTENKTIIESENYIRDLDATAQYLNGIYTTLANLNSGYKMVYPEVAADNIKPVSGSSGLLHHYLWEQQADDDYNATYNTNSFYRSYYSIIRSCNLVVQKANEFKSENQQKSDLLIGQALGIRAMLYFELVNTYAQSYNYSLQAGHAGVPYTVSPDWSLDNHRASVIEIYKYLIEDLESAAAFLEEKEMNSLYMNKNMAKGLLSKVYLFAEDFENAKRIAGAICRATPLMTMPDYPDNLFTLEDSESFFLLPPEINTYRTTYPGAYFSPSPKGQSLSFIATNDVAELVQEDSIDCRKNWVVKSDENWLINKFPSGQISTHPTPGGSYYPSLLRVSEVYLIAAEAYARLNMNDSARFFINAIRLRSNPEKELIQTSGEALLDSIYKERRKELAFEGTRLFDIMRWKQDIKRSDAPASSASHLSYPSDKMISPIPQRDVLISGLKQNPGY